MKLNLVFELFAHGLNKIGTCHCHQVITDGAASDISRTSEIQMH